MNAYLAVLALIRARARRRAARWVLPSLGIAVAVGFAGSVAAEAVIAGDQSARSTLNALPALDRSVRVTWLGVVTPSIRQQGQALLHRLDKSSQSEVVLLGPVRLSGMLVRPAAIAPLARWLPPQAARRVQTCRARVCPMLLAGGPGTPAALTAFDVRLSVIGRAPLYSAVPLGFAPAIDNAQMSLLVTGDVTGLEALPGLSGVYRSHSWIAPLDTTSLHSWQLGRLEARLAAAQSDLLTAGSQFRLTAPFTGLDAARAQAAAAPRRLLLGGGGVLAAIAVFILLAAGGVRRDHGGELERLRNAGARFSHELLFVLAESAWVCGVAVLAGSALALGGATVLASVSGEPTGGVLAHSLLTPPAAAVMVAGWAIATALIALSVLARSARFLDAVAVAAIAGLAVGLSLDAGSNDQLVLLLAPLCCLAGGVVIWRAAAGLLRAAERLGRRGPVLGRLALVGLARAPALPSLAIAFIAVTVGLGGFALAYRATLVRGSADQAADQVPLDALVSPGPNFKTPLQLAPPARWRTVTGGTVLPVRRTDAEYPSGGGTVTVPALAIPADGLPLLHGWRASDGSAPVARLAARLRPPDPVRAPGPLLPARARWLTMRASSPALAVSVTADLRGPGGAIHQVALGTAASRTTTLSARLPSGSWELEALELDEPSGLEITNGHQNGENPAAATQFGARVALGAVQARGPGGGVVKTAALGAWRAVGAAASVPGPAPAAAGTAAVEFQTTGTPGVLRPPQPSDVRPVPVLVDPQTAAAAGPGGRLALTVDGLPVTARVVGVLRRFPTLPTDAAGFVVADQPTLSAALDAGLPGQGRPDELWIATAHPQALRSALQATPLAQLSASFRADLAHELRAAPIARGLLRTLLAATALSLVLALLGLLVALLGAERDTRVEMDLEAQGVGPRGIRSELRVRLLLASVLGVLAGVAVATLLTTLAVATVRAAGPVAVPRPPLVTVIPWAQLLAWSLVALGALTVTSLVATWSAIGRERASRRPSPRVAESAMGEGVTS